jgi:hypothetical protein
MRTSPCSSSPAAGRSPAGDLSEELQDKVDFTAVGAVVDESLPIKSWSVLVAHLGALRSGVPTPLSASLDGRADFRPPTI